MKTESIRKGMFVRCETSTKPNARFIVESAQGNYAILRNITEGKVMNNGVVAQKKHVHRVTLHQIHVSERDLNRIKSGATTLEHFYCKTLSDLVNYFAEGDNIIFTCNVKGASCYCTATKIRRITKTVDVTDYSGGHTIKFIRIEGIDLIM